MGSRQAAAPGTPLALVTLGYLALAVVLTWPLVLGLGRDVPGDLGDSLLNMWILAWGAEHIPDLLTGAMGWEAFWNANIFHPEPYTLALSEHLVAQAVQVMPVYALTGNIILCYNLLFLSTFVLSAIGAYLLVRDLTGDWRAGVIAGLVYGFLPYRIAQLPHLQVLSSQWMPFALWGLHRYIAAGSGRALAGATAALVLQNLSCGYFLLFFAPFVPIFAVHQLWIAGRLSDRRAWLGLCGAALVTVVLTLPFLLPYREVQRLFAFERPLGEVVGFSANVWSYATATELVHLWGPFLRLHPHAEGETFLGITAVVLALVAVTASFVAARRSAASTIVNTGWRAAAARVLAVVSAAQALGFLSIVLVGGFTVSVVGLTIRATTPVRLLMQTLLALALLLACSKRARATAVAWVRSPALFFVAMAVAAAWLSLGPFPSAGPERVSGLGLYGLFYDYVPGFTGLRVPARYAMIAGLFLAIAAGYGVVTMMRWRHGAIAATLAGLLVVADGAAMPLAVNHTWGQREATPPARVFTTADAPPVYQRIKALADTAVVAEFPFGDPAWEIRYVYYASAHGRRIVNGYSGAFPPGYSRRAAAIARRAVDGDAAWQALVDAGTTHVTVHVPAFANPNEPRELMAWLESHGASIVDSFPQGDVLYQMP